MKYRSKMLAAVSVAGMMAAVTPLAAQAQTAPAAEEDTAEGDIIVTARRRAEALQDVPLAINALTGDDIEQRNIRRIDDLLQAAPGLTFDIGGFPNDTRPSLRGMTAERGRPSVAVLLDGHDLSGENISIAGGSSALRSNLFDLERLEIVRGPQSTLYGRNAFGGAINYISRKPEFDWGGSANFEAGTYGTFGATAGVTGPIIEDILAFRLNAAYRETDGFYTHPVNRGRLGAEKTRGVAAALRLVPTSGLTIDARYQYSKERMSDLPTAFIFANTRLPVPGGTFTAGPPGTPPQPCPASLTGLPAAVVTACTRGTVVGQVRATRANVDMGLNPNTGRPPFGMVSNLHVASGHIEYDTGSFGEFHYNFGYLKNFTDIEQDGDFHSRPAPPGLVLSISALQDLVYRNKHTDHTVYWTHEIDRFDFILGYQHFEETSSLLNGSQFWLRNPASPLAGPPFRLDTAPGLTSPFPVVTVRETKYDGFFGGFGFEIVDGLKISAEARYNRDRIDYSSTGWRAQDVTLSQLTPICNPALAPGATFVPTNPAGSPPPGTVNACPTSGAIRENQWTPRATIEYKPTTDLLFYVSWAKGFKPGGFNTNEVATLNGQQYLSEKVTTWEAGTKSTLFDGRMIANLAVYRNRYRDQQIGVQLSTPGAGGQIVTSAGIVNAGRVNIWGIEADVNVRLDDRWNVTVGYAYTDAKFSSFIQGPPVGANAAIVTQCGIGSVQTSSAQNLAEAGNICGDLSGNRPGKTPKHSLNLTLGFNEELEGDRRVYADITGLYRSKRFNDESNLNFLPSYWLMGARFGFDFGMLDVQLALDNLLDDRKIKSAQRVIDLGNPEGFAPGRGYIAYLPPPRTMSVRVGMKF